LGVVPGTEIIAEMRSASGDPTAYQIKGASIALRKELADRIYLIMDEEGWN
jgi:Fe2+ transport system protein FeoA